MVLGHVDLGYFLSSPPSDLQYLLLAYDGYKKSVLNKLEKTMNE